MTLCPLYELYELYELLTIVLVLLFLKPMEQRFLVISFFLILHVLPACGQNDISDTLFIASDTLNENSGIFDSDDLLTISLKFDISKYRKTKPDEEYLDAQLTYYTSNSDSVTKKLRVRARGEFRREYCSFPPILLNFRSEDPTWGGVAEINKLKMVTQCVPGNQESLFREYLVYKLYNILTDNSFRVRLLKVNYINTAKQNEVSTEYAFVIEPLEHLTKRINAAEARANNLDQKDVIPEMMDRMAIFNYMIGNTDWSVPVRHNVLLLAPGFPMPPDKAIVVPYDFDFSGLVNANYASPNPELKIKTVRERLYRGVCREEEIYVTAFREFLENEEEFYRAINEFPYLSDHSKKEMINYLDLFLDGIDNRKTVLNKIMYDCLKF